MAQIGGLDIPLSARGITGLEGVAYTPTGHPQRPYVATMNRNEVDRLTNGALGLDSSAYGYGGQSFHIGYFNDPRVAAWTRADFKNNPVPYVKAFQQARQQGNRGNLADIYQPKPPSDLDSVPLQPIADAVKEYEATRKRGGSEEDAIAAAEAKRQANMKQVAAGQANIAREQDALSLTQPGGALHQAFNSIPKGPDRGLAFDFIKDELAKGTDVKSIAKDLTDQMFMESIKSLVRIKQLIKY